MRLIKMFGLAAIAAVAAMAFVGAGSASATNTCVSTENTVLTTCGAQPLFVTFTALSSESALLTAAPKLTIRCNVSIKGHQLGLANPLQVHVGLGELTYSGCNNGCTAAQTEAGLLLILKTGPGIGTVSGHGFKVSLKCGELIECEYNAEGLVGDGADSGITGGKAHVTYASDAVKAVPGGLCPTSALLDGLFKSTENLYIRE